MNHLNAYRTSTYQITANPVETAMLVLFGVYIHYKRSQKKHQKYVDMTTFQLKLLTTFSKHDEYYQFTIISYNGSDSHPIGIC